MPGSAAWLGGAGLLPFVAGASTLWMFPAWAAIAESALVVYGAVILSFMGGCRWGLAAAGMGQGVTWSGLVISVAPALWAWPAVLIGGAAAAVMLACGLLVLLWADLVLTKENGAPTWWPTLRVPLSLGAAASLIVGAAAM